MRKPEQPIRNAVFLASVCIFIILVLTFMLGQDSGIPFSVIAVLGILFGLLGVVLTVLSVRLHETRTQKIFFILTGVSAAGIPICAILHNLVYALFIILFGRGFWGHRGDEPVFFILAVIIFPLLFLIGAVASGILLIKARIMGNKSKSPNDNARDADKPDV